MRIFLLATSFLAQLAGVVAMIVSSFSGNDLLYIKGAVILIIGLQIQSDKKIWQ